jgi:hypothetical protein
MLIKPEAFNMPEDIWGVHRRERALGRQNLCLARASLCRAKCCEVCCLCGWFSAAVPGLGCGGLVFGFGGARAGSSERATV